MAGRMQSGTATATCIFDSSGKWSQGRTITLGTIAMVLGRSEATHPYVVKRNHRHLSGQHCGSKVYIRKYEYNSTAALIKLRISVLIPQRKTLCFEHLRLMISRSPVDGEYWIAINRYHKKVLNLFRRLATLTDALTRHTDRLTLELLPMHSYCLLPLLHAIRVDTQFLASHARKATAFNGCRQCKRHSMYLLQTTPPLRICIRHPAIYSLPTKRATTHKLSQCRQTRANIISTQVRTPS